MKYKLFNISTYLSIFSAIILAANYAYAGIPTLDPLTDSGNVTYNASTVFSGVNTSAILSAQKKIKNAKAKYNEYKGEYEGVMLKEKAPIEGTKQIKKSSIADTSNPESVRRAIYDLFLSYPSNNEFDRNAYKAKAKKFYQDTVNEIYTAVRLLETDYLTNLKPKIDNMETDLMTGENGASVGSDDNGSWKNTYNTYKTMDDLTQLLEELTAMKVQYEAAQAIYTGITPALAPSKDSKKESKKNKKKEKTSFLDVNSSAQFASVSKNEVLFFAQVATSGKYQYRYNPNTDGPVSFNAAPKPNIDSPFAANRGALDDLDKLNPVYNKTLKALYLHNLIQSLPSKRAQFIKYEQYKKLHQKSVEGIKASEKCVINYLSGYYKDPEKTWNGGFIGDQVTDYDLREGLSGWTIKSYEVAKGSKIQPVNSAAFSEVEQDPSIGNEKMADFEKQKSHVEKVSKTNNGFVEAGEEKSAEKNNREMEMLAWTIGAKAMQELADDQYSASPKWGESYRKFAIWNDQKSYYNQYIDGKYENMKEYLDRVNFKSRITNMARELNNLSSVAPDLKLAAKIELDAMYEKDKNISEVPSDGNSQLTQLFESKKDDIATLQKNKAKAVEVLRQNEDRHLAELNASSTVLNKDTKLLNRVQVPVLNGNDEPPEGVSADDLNKRIVAEKQSVTIIQKNVNAVRAKMAEIEKSYVTKEQRLENKYAAASANLSYKSDNDKDTGGVTISPEKALEVAAYVAKLLNQSEGMFADTKKYAAKAIDAAKRDIYSNGDMLYLSATNNKVLDRHRKLIAELNNLPFAAMKGAYPSMNAAGSAAAVEMLTTAFQAVLTKEACVKHDCNKADEEYFVGSSGKGRDFTAPKAAPNTHAAPVREVVHLDYVDYQNIPKLPQDDSVAKDGMLNYGPEIPEVWKFMLANPAYVEKEMDFNNILSLGGESLVFMRGGIMPCRSGRFIIDANPKKATYSAIPDDKSSYSDCQLLQASMGLLEKNIGILNQSVKVKNLEVGESISAELLGEVSVVSPSELGIFLQYNDNKFSFPEIDRKVYNRLTAIMNDQSDKEYKENIPDNIYRHASFNENQIGNFLKFVEMEMEYRQILDELEVKIMELQEELKASFKEAGFAPAEDINLALDKDYDEARKALDSLKNSTLQSTTSGMGEINNPEVPVVKERLELLRDINSALVKDKDELIPLSENSKGDSEFDERLKSEAVNKEAADKHQKEADETFEKELNNFEKPYCAAY